MADKDLVLRDGQQVATAQSIPPGMLAFWSTATPPTNWLLCDGSAVLIASYAALAAAIYCGNGNNASASWGYKATTNVSPSSNRSTSGTYIVLPDARNRYFRGFQSGGAYGFWTYYEDEFEAHTHGLNNATSLIAFVGAGGSAAIGGGTAYNFATVTANNTGGTETRPRTIMGLPIIYAGP